MAPPVSLLAASELSIFFINRRSSLRGGSAGLRRTEQRNFAGFPRIYSAIAKKVPIRVRASVLVMRGKMRDHFPRKVLQHRALREERDRGFESGFVETNCTARVAACSATRPVSSSDQVNRALTLYIVDWCRFLTYPPSKPTTHSSQGSLCTGRATHYGHRLFLELPMVSSTRAIIC